MSHSKPTHHQTLTPTQPEWARMWESLFELTGSYTDHNPVSGEFWEYTGTFWTDRPAIGSLLPLRVLVHELAHLCCGFPYVVGRTFCASRAQ